MGIFDKGEVRELLEIRMREENGKIVMDLELENKGICKAVMDFNNGKEMSIKITGDDRCKELINRLAKSRGVF